MGNGMRACIFAILFTLLFALLVRAQEESPEDVYLGLTNLLSYVEALLLVLLYLFVIAILFVQETRAARGIPKNASILTDGWFWAFEILCGFLVVSLSFTAQPLGVSQKASSLVFLIGAIGAFLPLAVLLIAAFIANIYKKGMLARAVTLALWGVFASGVALSMNFVYSRSIGTFMGQSNVSLMLAVVLAPVFEEFVKGFGLVALRQRGGIGGTRLGLFYGFCIGIGFSAVESWLYFTSVASPFALGISSWAHVLVYRAVFATLGHGFFTSATGALLGKAREQDAMTRTALGLLISVALHSAFNATLVIPELTLFREPYMLLLTLGFIYALFKSN